MRPTAEEVLSDWAIFVFCALMFVSCSTMENDDICCIDSLVSIGLDGSWCCSWAMNSFRKPSLSSEPLLLATAEEPVRLSVPTVPVEVTSGLLLLTVLIEAWGPIGGQARTSTRTPLG